MEKNTGQIQIDWPNTQPAQKNIFWRFHMMVKPEITEKTKVIIARILGAEEEAIKDDSSMSSIASWDSLRHVNLIIALEQEFGVTFPDEEITLLTSVQLLSMKIAALTPA
jgi:acyl carrier protein